ncbi:MAG: DUF4293 domain-containing protein [Bacteroidales bacterium]|nr:DUF4293 domain-containing protein [Bacteroidales bacterium]
MLQRIQSFYLVLVVVGIVLMFKFPIVTFTSTTASGDVEAALKLLPTESVMTDDGMDYKYVGDDAVHMSGKWILSISTLLVGLIALVSIFLYKNRVLQMRVVAFAFLFNVITIFLIFFWAINGTGGSGGYLAALQAAGPSLMGDEIAINMLTPGTITPIVTVILLFLAQRAIKKDEMKVRAADRLR